MIRTKVARILSPKYIILAAGAAQGVHEGMEFVIYELSDPIIDPENGDSLGQIEFVKGRVRVFHVQEKMSHARTLSRTVVETINPFVARPLALEPRTISKTVYEELRVDGSVALEPDETVRVGDHARSVE